MRNGFTAYVFCCDYFLILFLAEFHCNNTKWKIYNNALQQFGPTIYLLLETPLAGDLHCGAASAPGYSQLAETGASVHVIRFIGGRWPAYAELSATRLIVIRRPSKSRARSTVSNNCVLRKLKFGIGVDAYVKHFQHFAFHFKGRWRARADHAVFFWGGGNWSVPQPNLTRNSNLF